MMKSWQADPLVSGRRASRLGDAAWNRLHFSEASSKSTTLLPGRRGPRQRRAPPSVGGLDQHVLGRDRCGPPGRLDPRKREGGGEIRHDGGGRAHQE